MKDQRLIVFHRKDDFPYMGHGEIDHWDSEGYVHLLHYENTRFHDILFVFPKERADDLITGLNELRENLRIAVENIEAKYEGDLESLLKEYGQEDAYDSLSD